MKEQTVKGENHGKLLNFEMKEIWVLFDFSGQKSLEGFNEYMGFDWRIIAWIDT